MKKITLFLLSVLLCQFFAQAQITLGAGDFPYAGLSLTYFEVTDSSGALNAVVTPGNPGANGTYNLGNVSGLLTDTTLSEWLSPSATPFPTQHPGCNLSLYWRTFFMFGDTSALLWNYYDASSTSVLLKGASAIVDTLYFSQLTHGPYGMYSASMSKDLEVMSSAYSLGYTYNDSAYISTQMFGGPFPLVMGGRVVIDLTIDGWGTLTTPKGTYSVLRAKQIWAQSEAYIPAGDPLDPEDFTETEYFYQYIFYAKGIGSPVAYINMNSAFTSVMGVKYADALPASFNEAETYGQLTVLPGYSQNQIRILNPGTKEGKFKMSVFDVSGKSIIREDLIIQSEATVDISRLSRGIYVIALDNGTSCFRTRIPVIK